MITRFRVKNYKALKDVDIPLTPIHVIIGQNDSGKTSLLEAILAFCRSADPHFAIPAAFGESWRGAELVFFGTPKKIVETSARLEDPQGRLQHPQEYGFKVVFEDSEEHQCMLLQEWVSNGSTETLKSRGGSVKSAVSSRFFPNDSPNEQEKLAEIAELIGSAFLYKFDARLMKTPAAYDEARVNRLDPDGFGLSTLLSDILENDRKAYDDLVRRFCEYFPEFVDIRLKTERGLIRHYDTAGMPAASFQAGKGIYFATRSGESVRARQASDGAVLFLGFLVLSYLPTPPKVLLIEEPETGVYPLRLRQIVHILKHLMDTDGDRASSQIIFTTHSPYILSEFTPEEVTFMSRDGDSVIARPLRDAPHIDERLGGGEFYLGELWYNIDEEELFRDGRSTSHH